MSPQRGPQKRAAQAATPSKATLNPSPPSARPRIEGSGFSFELPGDFEKTGDSDYRSKLKGIELRIGEFSGSGSVMSEQVCNEVVKGFVGSTGGQVTSRKVAQYNGASFCYFVIQTEKVKFVTALGLSSPFIVGPMIRSSLERADAEQVLDSILRTWRFKRVTSLTNSFLELQIPNSYVPYPNLVQPPALALIRKERVSPGIFMGSVVLVPTCVAGRNAAPRSVAGSDDAGRLRGSDLGALPAARDTAADDRLRSPLA